MRKQLQSPTSHGAKLGSPVRRRARVGTRGEPEGKPEGSPRRARGKPEGAVAEPPWRSRRGGATVADNRGRVAVTESPWRSHRGRRARGEPEGSPRGAGSRGRQPWQANRRASGESEGSRASRGRQPWTREPVPGSPGGLTSRNYQLWTCSHPPSPEAISLEKNGSSPTPVEPPWVVVGRVVVDRQSWGGGSEHQPWLQQSSGVLHLVFTSPRLVNFGLPTTEPCLLR